MKTINEIENIIKALNSTMTKEEIIELFEKLDVAAREEGLDSERSSIRCGVALTCPAYIRQPNDIPGSFSCLGSIREYDGDKNSSEGERYFASGYSENKFTKTMCSESLKLNLLNKINKK